MITTLESRLITAAQRWAETPFRERARVCGHGVDCVQLTAAILEEAGIGKFQVPAKYTTDFGAHADHSPLLAWFVEREWRCVYELADVEPGDVVLFRIGRVANHCGVALGDSQFIHCMVGCGTIFSRLDDPTYLRRFACAFRPPA